MAKLLCTPLCPSVSRRCGWSRSRAPRSSGTAEQGSAGKGRGARAHQHPGRDRDYIYGDLRDPDTLLRKAAGTLDFSKPAAVLLFGVLHFFAAERDPYAIVTRLAGALAPGSYLAISHLARDVHGEALTETFDRLNQQMNESVVLRTQAEVSRFFDGLDLVEPGVVQLPQWRPDPGPEGAQPDRPLPMWCAVGRKHADTAP